ncbi:MAG: VWA domain-containing protein [Deltaproteobacteria bacterium HGW-Deltaproteobacteria-14]|jgi:hypothetical protein|nr:MAG: VWA domain-containing protein [Deltaproteobacteria bacterium HGW-Deltaproteobacteria-14]
MWNSRSALVASLMMIGVSGVPVAASALSPVHKQRPRIEVAFVLDTTGSMGGLIEGAKKKIWSIASKIAKGDPTPELRVGLVGYRDRGDAYVTKRFDLTDNLDLVYENLQGFKADGGGDTPEHVGQALGEAVKEFSWSDDKRTLKMIFVVGDAPPQTYGDGWNYKEWAKKGIAQGIMINAVRCGQDPITEVAFREIANLADGQFITIDGSGGMLAVATPFDAEIAEVTRQIGETSLYAGRAEAREKADVAKRALGAMDDEAAADRAGYAAASGASVAAAPAAPGVKDLVAEEPARVASVPEAELPAALRDLSAQERVAKVAALQAKRAVLEKKLVALSKQRDEHISKAAPEREDSFDGAVMKEVRSKAARIGVTYK